jgi:branched-chain amino acid transport system permease protein
MRIQILVTFGLAIVLQEVIKAFFGTEPGFRRPRQPYLQAAPISGSWIGLGD